MQTNHKIILGVDPGTVVMGYALLSVAGGELRMLEMEAVRLKGGADMYERLSMVFRTVTDIISRSGAAELAIEAPFFGKNVQSMLKLGRAQGVAIAAAMQRGVPVAEYSPRRIKQAITGNGNAGKEKLWQMLRHMMTLPEAHPGLDASDALAVAVCHHYETTSPVAGVRKAGKSGDWASFIRENPHRVRKPGSGEP